MKKHLNCSDILFIIQPRPPRCSCPSLQGSIPLHSLYLVGYGRKGKRRQAKEKQRKGTIIPPSLQIPLIKERHDSGVRNLSLLSRGLQHTPPYLPYCYATPVGMLLFVQQYLSFCFSRCDLQPYFPDQSTKITPPKHIQRQSEKSL